MRSTTKVSQKTPPGASPNFSPKLPWPIPPEGAWLEVAQWLHDSTSSRNAWINKYVIRVRLEGDEFFRYAVLASYRFEVDQVTQREQCWPLFGIVYAGLKITRQQLRASSCPPRLVVAFEQAAETLRRFAEKGKQNYERRLAAQEDW